MNELIALPLTARARSRKPKPPVLTPRADLQTDAAPSATGWQVGQRVVDTIGGRDRRIVPIVAVLVNGDCTIGHGHGQRYNAAGVHTDCWGHLFPGITIRPATAADEKRLAMATLRHALADLAWKSKSRVSDKQVREICAALGIKP